MKQDQIVIYQTKDGQTQIDVRLENENVWLNVSQMSALFDREESNVRRHVQNAFKEGELERDENNVHFLHVNGDATGTGELHHEGDDGRRKRWIAGRMTSRCVMLDVRCLKADG